MISTFTDEFNQLFDQGMQSYLNGNWSQAQ